MEVFFCKKSGKWGCFVKKWTFPQRRVHYVQYQYFLFFYFTYLGGVRTHPTNAPPCLRACIFKNVSGEKVTAKRMAKPDVSPPGRLQHYPPHPGTPLTATVR